MQPLNLYHKSRIFRYCCVIAWAALIFFFSSQPQLPSAPAFAWDFVMKKVAHILVYFILYVLVYRAVSFDEKQTTKASLLSLCACLLYAVSDEFHQSFVPGRTPNARDIVYDSIGMLTAWLAIFKYI